VNEGSHNSPNGRILFLFTPQTVLIPRNMGLSHINYLHLNDITCSWQQTTAIKGQQCLKNFEPNVHMVVLCVKRREVTTACALLCRAFDHLRNANARWGTSHDLGSENGVWGQHTRYLITRSPFRSDDNRPLFAQSMHMTAFSGSTLLWRYDSREQHVQRRVFGDFISKYSRTKERAD